jgi:predicted nuclease of predicted toxin-antitoxin system
VKFKVDENLPVELACELESLGHDADTVEDEGLSGEPDSGVVARARAEDRIIITLDKGLADVFRFPIATHAGVVLFRPGSLGRKAVLAFIRERLPSLLERELANRITVVTADRIRFR